MRTDLAFLSFNGDDDGEDLKTVFKVRLAYIDMLPTSKDREDIVLAAQGLFDDCIALVGMLNRAVWWYKMRARLHQPPIVTVLLLAILIVMLVASADLELLR